MELEIAKIKARPYPCKSEAILSIMEDFYHIILGGNFSDETVQKMLGTHNLLQELTDLWRDNDRVMQLQEKMLQEFLNS